MTPTELLDRAKEVGKLNSDRKLAEAIGLNSNTAISFIRRGVSLPSDETTVKLAELAGLDPQIALLQLNVWRAKTDTTKNYYHGILSQFVKAGSVAAIALMTGIMADPGQPIHDTHMAKADTNTGLLIRRL